MKKTLEIINALAIAVAALTLSTTAAHATRPLGVDVYDGNGSINWEDVYNSGVSFVYVKATEGTYYEDANYNYNIATAQADGLYGGAYDFARPDLDTPSEEASYFWNFAKGHIGSGGESIMPALDMETWNGVDGASSYTAWANDWCADVVSLASAAGKKVHPVVYVSSCNACYFTSSLTGYPWLANYNGEDLYTGNPWNTCTSCEVWGSGVWDFWQASDTGSCPGITDDCDFDTYNGTLSQMLTKMLITAE
jgi:GH25 family lysozyme M1 (1,4-beta-N-acetylmuramidase)